MTDTNKRDLIKNHSKSEDTQLKDICTNCMSQGVTYVYQNNFPSLSLNIQSVIQAPPSTDVL